MIRQVRAPEFEYPSQNTASSRQKWLAQRSLSPQHSNDRKGRQLAARRLGTAAGSRFSLPADASRTCWCRTVEAR
jgi:hypothetical protein